MGASSAHFRGNLRRLRANRAPFYDVARQRWQISQTIHETMSAKRWIVWRYVRESAKGNFRFENWRRVKATYPIKKQLSRIGNSAIIRAFSRRSINASTLRATMT